LASDRGQKFLNNELRTAPSTMCVADFRKLRNDVRKYPSAHALRGLSLKGAETDRLSSN
jgi:hypothetical protein